jgi:hypothetical protein
MTQHPLTENYYALLLCIIKRYSIDESLMLMKIGAHVYSENSAPVIHRERERSAGGIKGPRRPPEHARLARLYS